MIPDKILDIVAYGAWNGGRLVDNSVYEKRGLVFKGGIPVDSASIESRIGVRTRMAAPADERIGQTALQNLLETSGIDPSRIRLIIGATNVGDDKYEHGPQVRHAFETVRRRCPQAVAFDLYAGCPGFNVAVELVLALSADGWLRKDDLSVIIGAENIHRAKAFRDNDTANIIFGDDALATALQTESGPGRTEGEYRPLQATLPWGADFELRVAAALADLCGGQAPNGIIVDNQLGNIIYRVPATAARLQHRLVERLFPKAAAEGVFGRFGEALAFYNRHVNSFAFDIMSLGSNPEVVEQMAAAYVHSGKYRRVASIFLEPASDIRIVLHTGKGYAFHRPRNGIVDAMTRTHGCFGDYIQAVTDSGDVFGEMDGKGVFLYATRGARPHLTQLLSANGLSLDDIELLIEHQANFAMIPLTLAQLLADASGDVEAAVAAFVADRMVTNIHERGNCSVVCMQRLPYDLQRGRLAEDVIQGFAINRNVDTLKHARRILFDSVGAGMTRSSFILKH